MGVPHQRRVLAKNACAERFRHGRRVTGNRPTRATCLCDEPAMSENPGAGVGNDKYQPPPNAKLERFTVSDGQMAGSRPRAQARSKSAGVESMLVLLEIGEVAELLATTPRHVRRLVAERRLPYIKVGRFVRFLPSDLARWLEQQRIEPNSQRPQVRRIIGGR